jgi:hypothetical protein
MLSVWLESFISLYYSSPTIRKAISPSRRLTDIEDPYSAHFTVAVVVTRNLRHGRTLYCVLPDLIAFNFRAVFPSATPISS